MRHIIFRFNFKCIIFLKIMEKIDRLKSLKKLNTVYVHLALFQRRRIHITLTWMQFILIHTVSFKRGILSLIELLLLFTIHLWYSCLFLRMKITLFFSSCIAIFVCDFERCTAYFGEITTMCKKMYGHNSNTKDKTLNSTFVNVIRSSEESLVIFFFLVHYSYSRYTIRAIYD